MDLIAARSLFAPELQNPSIRDRLFGMTHAEVGGQGPQAQQAFLESIFNRAAARNQPLGQTLSGSYFPAVTYQRAARGVNDSQRGRYEELLGDVLGGSNAANYATGNASGTVGFAGGPQTAAYGGERFGVEGPDRAWAQSMGFGGEPMAYAGGSPAGELPQQAPDEIPQNAQPTSGILSQGNKAMPGGILGGGQQQGGGLLANLIGGFAPGASDWLNQNRNAIRGAFSGQALEGGQLDQQQQNNRVLAQYVAQAPDIPEQLRPLLAQNPQLAQAFITQNFVKPQTTDDIKEFELARKQGYTGNFVDFKQAQRAQPQDKSIPTQVAQREAEAQRLGMKPGDPAYQSYVLSGKLPREDAQPLTATDKKAIMESEESVLSADNSINALKQAKALSPQANTGFGASLRATIGNNLPDALVPDALSSPKSSEATANYENIVNQNAVASLKSIFGGNPTEGERKILLELQASVGKPDKVRQDILDRAIALAEKRKAFHAQRAEELRGQSYYKPGGGAAKPRDPLLPNLKSKYGLE